MNSGRQIYTVLLFLLATSSPGIALASGPLHDPTQQLLAPPINTMAGPTTGESTSNSHIYRPPQVPLDVQQYPVAPAGLELEQVHVYMRHGTFDSPCDRNGAEVPRRLVRQVSVRLLAYD